MNQQTTLSDRLRASAARVGADGHATQAKEQTQVKVKQEVEIAQQAADDLKIKENPFYKALTDPQATQEDKIGQIASALNPKELPMDKVEANLRAFQEYYTYIQSEELEEAVSNIQRLMDELKNNSKIEITNILKSLKGMLDDVKQCRDLVEVLRKARLSGQTIKELQAAVDHNDELNKRLADLAQRKKKVDDEIARIQGITDKRLAERDEESKKLSNRVLRVFGRHDTTFDDRVTEANKALEARKQLLTTCETETADLEKARNKDLESGPLTILRSLDEADDSLTDRLMSSGDKGVTTIRGAQKSVLQLMDRALFSEEQVGNIARRVSDKQITLTVLRSGLSEASKNTNDFKEDLQTKSGAAEGALSEARAAATPDVLNVAKKETAAITVRADVGRAIDYQGRLNDTITEMNVTVSKNVERQGEMDRSKEIVQGTKKSITVLGRDTLNTVAGNLEGVLHNLVADQTDETQQAVTAFAHAAEEVKQGSLEGMMERKKEMHNQDMSLLDDTIKRLNASSDMIAKTLEISVDEGVARAAKQKELQDATKGLDEATSTMRTVVGKMSEDTVKASR